MASHQGPTNINAPTPSFRRLRGMYIHILICSSTWRFATWVDIESELDDLTLMHVIGVFPQIMHSVSRMAIRKPSTHRPSRL